MGQRRVVTDLIDHIDELSKEPGHEIQTLAMRDAELKAGEDLEGIDLGNPEDAELDITPYADAREDLLKAGPSWDLQRVTGNTIHSNWGRSLQTDC
jgi:hypothetical protein